MSTKQLPYFSVVIPLYNMAATIAKAVDSVLAQTWTDFELLMVDDGSTDGGTATVGRISDSRVRVISQPNAGVSAARNTGIRHAAANYVTFLDADDAYEPGFLTTLYDLIQRYPDAGLYIASYRVIGATYQAIADPAYPELPEVGVIEDFVDIIFRRQFLGLISSSSCIDKGIVGRIGYFQEGVHFAEDSFYWLHLALHFPVVFTRIIGATVHSDTGRGGNLISPRRRYVSAADFQANHPCQALLTDLDTLALSPVKQAQLRQIIALSFAEIAVLHLYHGLDEIAEAVLHFAQAQDTPVCAGLLKDRTVAFCDQLIVHKKPDALRQMLATPHLGHYPGLELFYRLYLLAPNRRWLRLRHRVRSMMERS